MKIRISPADVDFSNYIRTRDGWTCQKCFKKFKPPTMGLHCAHCFTRRAKSTRFDTENCIALCYGCHSYLDSHPDLKYQFWARRIGQDRFDSLRLRSHIPQKVDEKMVRIWCAEKMKEFKCNS